MYYVLHIDVYLWNKFIIFPSGKIFMVPSAKIIYSLKKLFRNSLHWILPFYHTVTYHLSDIHNALFIFTSIYLWKYSKSRLDVWHKAKNKVTQWGPNSLFNRNRCRNKRWLIITTGRSFKPPFTYVNIRKNLFQKRIQNRLCIP